MTIINISVPVDDSELWMEVFGSEFEQWSQWLQGIEFIEGDWKTPGRVVIQADDPEDEGGTLVVPITVRELAKALGEVMADGRSHCGHYRIDHTFNDWDSCCGEIVLQYAIYGSDVY